MFCKKCGKELEDETVFCQFCGQKQVEDVSEKEEKKEEQISNKRLVLSGAVMAAVILAVIAGFQLIGREKEKAATGNEVVEETEETADITEEPAEEISKEEAAEPFEEEVVQEGEEAAEGETLAEKPHVSHITAGENEYWFDEDGDLVRAKSGSGTLDISYLTDAEGKKVEMSERIIDLCANLELYDLYGILCNTKGHLLTRWNWDYGNGAATKETCTHDGGNIVKMQMTETGDGGGWSEDTSFQYDEGTEQITISKHTLDLRTDVYEYWNVYTCFFEGDKLKEYLIDNSDSLDAHRRKEYDADGNLVRDKFDYNTGNDNTEETIYQYDGSGNLLRCEKAEKSEYEGVEIENTVTTDIYQYDEKGNRVKQESETQGTREGKKYEDHTTIEYQYDESGNKIQEKFNQVSPEYNETGMVVKQSVWDRNYIWEYDAEGKLVYYSSLFSSTGNDVKECESEYLYDEQGRLSEIVVDGETAMVLSYMDEELSGQANLVKEIENVQGIDNHAFLEWSVIENLFPNGEIEEIDFFDFSDSVLNGENIVIEYR